LFDTWRPCATATITFLQFAANLFSIFVTDIAHIRHAALGSLGICQFAFFLAITHAPRDRRKSLEFERKPRVG
jgi:hypothetical protein